MTFDQRLNALQEFIRDNRERLSQGVDFAHHAVMRFAFLYKAACDNPCDNSLKEAEAAAVRLQSEWGEL